VVTLLFIAIAGAGDKPAKKAVKKQPTVEAEIGKPAPDFTLTDVDGKEHKLSQYKGKTVVLEWTNHRCPYVVHHQAKAHTMQTTAARYKDKDVVWLAIDSSHYAEKQKDSIKKFAVDNGITVPILVDASGTVGKMYGARTTPHMFVINAEGVLVYTGAIDDNPDPFSGKRTATQNYVAQAVDACLAGRKVKTASTKPYGCSVKYARLAGR
jgi:peroxiredoxin